MSEPYRSSSTRAPGSLRCLFCGALHSPNDAACGACNCEVGRVRCSACPNWIAAGETVCACGARSHGAAAHGALGCPRCHGTLRDLSLEGVHVTVHQCERCLGTFIEVPDWSELADRAALGERLPIGSFVPLAPDEELPRQTLLAAVECPACAASMERVTFGVRSRTVVDVCKLHGLWLDAGELVAVLAFVTYRQAHPELPQSQAETEEDASLHQRSESSLLGLRLINELETGSRSNRRADPLLALARYFAR